MTQNNDIFGITFRIFFPADEQ